MKKEELDRILTRDDKFKKPLSKQEKINYLKFIVGEEDYLEAINYLKEEQKTVCLNKLKEQYKESLGGSVDDRHYRRNRYNAVRTFCLDTQLIDFNTIELMESEVNNEVNSSFSS